VPQLRVWVLRVEFQSYLSGRLGLDVGRLVFVGKVHEIVGEGSVVVVLQPAWGELTGDESLDVGLGETSLWMSAQVAGNARGGLETRYIVLKEPHFFGWTRPRFTCHTPCHNHLYLEIIATFKLHTLNPYGHMPEHKTFLFLQG